MADQVEISVLRSAKGAVVRSGDVLGVLYSGSLVNGNGVPFDGNYDFVSFSGLPGKRLFEFTLGLGQVIQGWDQALVGRRLGEVLDLTIPAELAYGSKGSAPSIPPDAPLRFRVELVGAIPAGTSKPLFPTIAELGVSKKLAAQLDALKPKFGGIKTGTDQDDTLTGGVAKDLLIGLGGDDLLQGAASADVLIGGPGSNRFVYADLSDSPAKRGKQDQILGFQRVADRIDLSALGTSFIYVGKTAFSRDAAEVRFSGGALQLDADGNGRADLEILLPGVNRFSGTSLLL
jgi:Ca2+-binding RTX toxin-like protein